MEARLAKFRADAEAKLPQPKLGREISALRAFLQKHQNGDFSDKDKATLFMAISAHVNNPAARVAAEGATDGAESPAQKLVEDALKLPFTIMTTTSKKQLLTWLDQLIAESARAEAAASGAGSGAGGKVAAFLVLDLSEDGYFSLLDEESGAERTDVSVTDATAKRAIAAALGRGAEVIAHVREGVVPALVRWEERAA
jgi:hypothetical protein